MAGKTFEDYEMKRGIKQGDSLSTILFIIFRDKIMKTVRETGNKLNTIIGQRNIKPVKPCDMDDVVLIVNFRGKIQNVLNLFSEDTEKMKTEVNTGKTKTMLVNKKRMQD